MFHQRTIENCETHEKSVHYIPQYIFPALTQNATFPFLKWDIQTYNYVPPTPQHMRFVSFVNKESDSNFTTTS